MKTFTQSNPHTHKHRLRFQDTNMFTTHNKQNREKKKLERDLKTTTALLETVSLAFCIAIFLRNCENPRFAFFSLVSITKWNVERRGEPVSFINTQLNDFCNLSTRWHFCLISAVHFWNVNLFFYLFSIFYWAFLGRRFFFFFPRRQVSVCVWSGTCRTNLSSQPKKYLNFCNYPFHIRKRNQIF